MTKSYRILENHSTVKKARKVVDSAEDLVQKRVAEKYRRLAFRRVMKDLGFSYCEVKDSQYWKPSSINRVKDGMIKALRVEFDDLVPPIITIVTD